MPKQKRVYGQKLWTPKGRLAFPFLLQPDSRQGGEPKFKCSIIFDPKDEAVKAELKKMKAECQKVAQEAFGKTEGVKMPFRNGNEKADKYEGYKDMIFISASTTRRPGVVGPNPKDHITLAADIYGGCYVRATLVPASYVMAGSPGVSFYLNNVQKLADGEPFGGTNSAPEDDFDASEEVGGEPEQAPDDEDMLGF